MSTSFITTRGVPLQIENSYKNQTAFLIGGGASFKNIKKELLKMTWTMTVNNASASFRGNAHCTVDDPSRFSLSVWLDPTVEKFVPAEHFEKPLWDNRLLKTESGWRQQWGPSTLRVADCPNIVGFRRNDIFRPAEFLHEPTINWGCRARDGGGKSVMLPALRILFLLGFRKVFLLGVDFEMSKDNKYHFQENRSRAEIAGNLDTYKKLERWLSELQPYFLRENFIVQNCNSNSKLKVFPNIPFEDAIQEATDQLGDYTRERTIGMYARQEDRLIEFEEQSGADET